MEGREVGKGAAPRRRHPRGAAPLTPRSDSAGTPGLIRTRPFVAAQNIGLSKTGYINEAGRCLVMQAEIAARQVVIVLLDSWGKYTRLGDANRITDPMMIVMRANWQSR